MCTLTGRGNYGPNGCGGFFGERGRSWRGPVFCRFAERRAGRGAARRSAGWTPNLVRPMRRELEPREVAVDRVRLHHVPELRERGAYLDAR